MPASAATGNDENGGDFRRLGLADLQVLHADRHGLLSVSRGALRVESGAITFSTAGTDDLPAGVYSIPHQTVSMLLIGPGTTLTHDVLRVLANARTGLFAVGDDGVRLHFPGQAGPAEAAMARRHAEVWADRRRRYGMAMRLYRRLLPDPPPRLGLEGLRGLEGSFMKSAYAAAAREYGIPWAGRDPCRASPWLADAANQAINHASSAVRAAALVAVQTAGAVPQLGFIHENSSQAFALDIADQFRVEAVIPVAFSAARDHLAAKDGAIEKIVRRRAGEVFRREGLLGKMMDRVADLFPTTEKDDAVHGDRHS